MKFAFAGTPQFGAWVLEELVRLGRTPVWVVSQPARPYGRGQRVQDSPVTRMAAHLGLPCLATENVNDKNVSTTLKAAGVESVVVAAFGQLFGDAFLDAFTCLNVHPSLLPRYRGPAPIHWALRNGDAETGVSIMRIVRELDAGPVALQTRLSISPYDDSATLARSLAVLGAIGVDIVLSAIEDGTVAWTEQSPAEATYAPKLSTSDRALNLALPASKCHDHVRSLVPEAPPELVSRDLHVQLLRTWPWPDGERDLLPAPVGQVMGQPGLVARCGAGNGSRGKDRLFVGCGEGALEILALKPAGRKPMRTPEFLRGYGSKLGETLLPPSADVM